MAVTYQDRPPEIHILFGSLNRSLSAFNLVEAEIITAVNAVPVANLTFESLAPEGKVSTAENGDLGLCRPGSDVALRAGTTRSLFAGIVTNQSFSVVRGRTRLKLELQHPLCRPRDKIRSRVFSNVRDGEIVSRILAEHKLRARDTQWLTISNRQMVQSAITDWAMIVARTAANAMWLAATEDGAQVIQPKLAAVPDRIVSQDDLVSDDSPIASVDWAFNVQTKRIEVSAWNIQQQMMTKARRAAQPRIGRGALDPDRLGAVSTSGTADLTSSVTLSPAELAGWADTRMLAMRAAGVRTELCLAGTDDFKLGDTLRLDGFGTNLDGDGLVSAVRQTFTQGRWRTYVRTGQPPAAIDADLLPGEARMTIGIVDKLKRDPDGWYRIEVTLPTFENSPSIWARLMLPYASTNAGFFFYPEKGDEAAVEFMDGDPRMPVVTGFFSNPRRKPAIAPHEDQGEKGIFIQRTTGQQRLTFRSRDNRVELNNAKSSLTMTDDVDVTARAQLAANGKAVKLQGQSMEVEGKRVLIKGKKIDMM